MATVLALALVVSGLLGASPAQSAEPATVTADTTGATLGGTVRLEGAGWLTADGSSGSVIAVKIDDGAYSRLPDDAVHPNRTIWAIIEAAPDGTFSADLTLPDGTDSTPALAPGQHTLRLLTGSLKTGDVSRTMLVPGFDVTAPSSTTTLRLSPATTPYGGTVRADVTVTSDGAPAAGDVVLTSGSLTLGRFTLVGGAGSLSIPSARLGVGRHPITASYAGPRIAPSKGTATATLTAARSTTRLSLKPAKVARGKRATATVAVTSALTPVGAVCLMKGSKKVATATLAATARGTLKIKLPVLAKGKHKLTAVFRGSSSVARSTSKAVVLTVR